MTDRIEDDLRRALDDVLATCWADEISILEALTEALAAMAAAVDKVSGTTTSCVFTVALTEALRDWSAIGDTVGRDLDRSF